MCCCWADASRQVAFLLMTKQCVFSQRSLKLDGRGLAVKYVLNITHVPGSILKVVFLKTCFDFSKRSSFAFGSVLFRGHG